MTSNEGRVERSEVHVNELQQMQQQAVPSCGRRRLVEDNFFVDGTVTGIEIWERYVSNMA